MDKQEILLAAIKVAIDDLLDYASSAENTDQVESYTSIAKPLIAALITCCGTEST
jgi:hypothetical protein